MRRLIDCCEIDFTRENRSEVLGELYCSGCHKVWIGSRTEMVLKDCGCSDPTSWLSASNVVGVLVVIDEEAE